MIKAKRALSLTMIALMMIGVFALLGTEQAHAAKKYKLPGKIAVSFYYDGTWDKPEIIKYAYDKEGNIKKMRWDGFVEKYKNTYKKGKLVKVKGNAIARYYNSKGRCTKEKYGRYVTKFKTNSKGYIVRGKGHFKFKNSVKLQKNGMPAKVKHVMGSETTIIKFARNGRIKTKKYIYRGGFTKYRYKYKKTSKGYQITEQVKEKGMRTWVNNKRLTMSFSKKKTKDPRKFVAMFNQHIDYEVMAGLMPEHFFSYGNG